MIFQIQIHSTMHENDLHGSGYSLTISLPLVVFLNFQSSYHTYLWIK